jgi:Cdc6-like AAA superfamily ATPase
MRSSFELIGELRRISQTSKMTVCFDNFVRLEDASVIDKVIALGVPVILVSSVERELKLLAPNSSHRLRRVIQLKNYGNDEALKILKKRAQDGLARDSFSEDVIESIVRRTDGNIALGISVLRAASLRAETQGGTGITPEDVESVAPSQREELEMNEDERLIVKILREKGLVEHRQLYNLYCQSASMPKQERTFRNYMQRLIGKSLVRMDFSEGLRTYRLVERD